MACSFLVPAVWAPEVRPSPLSGGYILSFTASRFSSYQDSCPDYDEGSGVFVSWSQKPLGPYDSPQSHPHPTGRNVDWCPDVPETAQPFSWEVDHHDCDPAVCNNTMRLDSDLYNDPDTAEAWYSYAWYTNSEVVTPFDHKNLGEHVSIVKVNASSPEWVSCQTEEATKVWAVSPHDAVTLEALNNSCPRCSEQLSFSKGRLNETMMRDGVVWGVVEAPMVFRRGDYVYLLASHSAWDSAYYSVMWIAALTVEGLDLSNGAGGDRLVGRFLIPSLQQSFGHGTAVLGPDGESWYYVHHHLDHTTCTRAGIPCPRSIYISPLNFEDRGDGRGDVWIKEVFPAEELQVKVYQPANSEPLRGSGSPEEIAFA